MRAAVLAALAAALLAGETGGVDRKTSNDPQRAAVKFSADRPAERSLDLTLFGKFRLIDERKGQLKDVRRGVTTTLQADFTRSLTELLRLDLYVRMHGAELGVALWKGTKWS